jgi:isopenicillin-N epimerase
MNSLRDKFLLDPDVTFLNHGSFGATPRPVFESYQYWQMELERNPVNFFARRAGKLLEEARAVLAGFLGTARDNVVFAINATSGMSAIVRSLDLDPGDEVLSTDLEYGSINSAWRFHAHQRGFCYINHPMSGPLTTPEDFVERLWTGVTPRTKVISFSHITWGTACILPVKEICRRAREAGILSVIDGAHAPGQIPVSLDDIGADFYAGNLHKWVCAPKGSGFIYVRPERQHLMKPLVVAGHWEPPKDEINPFLRYHQGQGTRDYAAFLAVPAAIHFQQDHDWPAVRARCHALALEAERRILALSGQPSLYPDDSWFSQLMLIPTPQIDWQKHGQRLWQDYMIEIPILGTAERPAARLSIQAYNTLADVEKFVGALRDLAAETERAAAA